MRFNRESKRSEKKKRSDVVTGRSTCKKEDPTSNQNLKSNINLTPYRGTVDNKKNLHL